MSAAWGAGHARKLAANEARDRLLRFRCAVEAAQEDYLMASGWEQTEVYGRHWRHSGGSKKTLAEALQEQARRDQRRCNAAGLEV